MKKYLLGLFVVLVAVSLSAFTSPRSQKPFTDRVWFEVNTSGVIQNPTMGVYQANPPAGLNCQLSALDPCSYAYDLGDVTSNGDGTYTIKPETSTFHHATDFDDLREKN